MAPGSIPPEATEIYQEGLRIPPVLLTPEVEAMLFANSRTGSERRGDLDAQRGANQVGVARLAEHWPTNHSTRSSPTANAACAPPSPICPTAPGRFDDTLDSTGAGPDHRRPARVALTLTIHGDTATFDFTGTDDQRPGNVNAVEAVTVSAVAFALRSATDPTIPANGGAMRPVTIVAPPGTLVAARPPAAVGRRQRRGQPTGRRRLLRRAGPGLPRPGLRRRPGHDEQPPHRRRTAGSTTRRSPAARAPARIVGTAAAPA